MPKFENKPLQGESIRGRGESLTVTKTGCNCNIPEAIISRLGYEMQGVEFGGVSLIITIRDGHPTFRIEKTLSFMAGI